MTRKEMINQLAKFIQDERVDHDHWNEIGNWPLADKILTFIEEMQWKSEDAIVKRHGELYED
jgi:hypothetical protein